jgi:oligosaccharide reducing-end xylanase
MLDRKLRAGLTVALCAAGILSSCAPTVDSLGDNGPEPGRVYPNAFRDVLSKTDDEIAAKVTGAFQQLFHGEPSNEAIYVPVGANQAYVKDFYFNNVRSEAMGQGMMVALQLDKKEEFDRIWTWTKTFMQFTDGPSAGNFHESCSTMGTSCSPGPEPYGSSYIVTSLLFASRRWTNGSAIYDYALEAQSLLDIFPSMFDAASALAINGPTSPPSDHATPARQIPAFAELWADAAGNDFWRTAAASARTFWRVSANPATGLVPGSADFSGVPVAGFEDFGFLSYPFSMDLMMDHVWFGSDPWQVTEADRVLAFFIQQGISSYVDRYTLDGMAQGNVHSTGLVSMNGAIAMAASTSGRIPFMQAVWDVAIPTGLLRYGDGILYMLSLLALSGNFRVY